MGNYVADEVLLKRGRDETYDAYKVRLCLSKLSGEIDISWNTIVDLLDFGCSGDHMRKLAYGMKEYDEYIKSVSFEDKVVGKALLKEMKNEREKLDKARKALEIEKVKVQTLRNDPRRVVREDSRSELYLEELIRAVEGSVSPKPKSYPIRPKGKREMIVPIADIHYGKEILVKDPLGRIINEYSPEVFEERMWKLLSEIRELATIEGIQNIHLFNLSDSIDGILRMSQLQSLRMGISESVVKFAKFMIVWLKELIEFVDVDYYSSLGNHNEIRPLGSNSGDFPHENTEYLITEMIKIAFEECDNVRIHETKNFNYVEIANHKLLVTHGQNEKNLTNSIKDYKLMFDIDIDMLLTGHLHSSHQETIGATIGGNVEYIQVPSICGVDDYAIKIKKNAKAGAKILVLDSNKTTKTTYDITLN